MNITRLLLALWPVLFLTWFPAAAQESADLPDYVLAEYGSPPAIPKGALSDDLQDAIDIVIAGSFDQANWDSYGSQARDVVIQSKDPRVVWLLADLMRFTWRKETNDALSDMAIDILGIELETLFRRNEIIDHLIAWDMPAYPGYLQHKRRVYTKYVPGWERIFVEGNVDWHLVEWGGVNIDDRPYDTTADLCSCIPAIDNPDVSTADEATWLTEKDIVFGIEVNGEYRAYPRRIMEVREMVNDTLGGRDLGIPYCTLCGAAQAYFTDQLPEGVRRPILRTSGLLIRSNKVMYDVNTYSVFDTFLGKAVTGPLAEVGLQLDQVSVVTTDWGAWKAAHPETTVLIEELALGRDFDLRNTRDAKGPIFPVGDIDPRFPVQEDIIGIMTASGQPIAFQRSAAFTALRQGQEVGFENIRLKIEAGGIKAVDTGGHDLGSHQAFWFAWSQFHPQTWIWPE